MGLIRSIACAFLCVLCLDSWTDGLFSSCSAQQVDNQSKRIPYQRVFIPSDDLTSIGIEEFVPIDVKRLEELIDRHSNNAIANTPSKLRDDQGGVTLISSFYVAKLVGADLLSERSRLSFSGTARWGERVALRPWSLAVQPPTVAGVRPDSQTLPNWSFDASGIPRISMVPNEPSGIQPNAVPNSLISLFGWSSKAAADSTTNNLKFSVEVPKCANSCLVLALPPQAVIQDCTTVVKRLEDWSAIALRLNDWEDFAKLPLEQNLVRSPESLWLIELGGSSVFSFSIELGINRSKEDTLSETQPFKHLIPSQKVEHFIEEEMIRTTCEAAIAGSPQQMVRFRLATGARIRRLAVNQQDVEWEVEEGWIRWRLGGGASPARTEDVFVEFFSPLLADNQSLFELPRIVFDRSYVMVGTESVQCDPSWKLTHSECDTGRLSERPTDFKSGSVSKIEYAWSANPPSHIVGLKRSPAERRSEFLTRLSNDPKKTTATVRARLSFAEQDANHVSFAVAPNWQIVSVQSLDPKDSITVQSKVDPENATALNLNWGRLLKSRVADIEIHLHRLADSPPDTMRRLAILPLVQSIGWTRTDTIVVEDSPVFDFQLHDSLLDAMVAEESISDWQKTYLPRTDKHFVFRYDSSNSPLGATQASPIALEWREAPNRLQTSLTTEVDKINDSTLLARHEIQLRLGADANAFVSITLPFRNAYWRLKQEGKWIPLNPLASSTALADPSTGVWQFDSKQLGQECTLMAVVQSDISAEREVTFRMPQVSNANILSHEVRSLGSDIAIHCVVAGSQWEIDPRGNKFLALPHSGKPVDLVARVSKSIPSQKWLAVDSELHIAVDSIGSQRACLLLRSHTSAQTEMTVELAEGWDTMAVFSSHAGKPKRVLYRVDETDGRRLILMPESHPEGELEIQMELIGPRLAKKFSLVSLGQTFLFEWPKIQTQAATLLEQRVLWLPGDLQRNTSEEKGLIWDKERERWPVWTWWKSMVASLNGSTKSTAVPLPMRHLAAAYGQDEDLIALCAEVERAQPWAGRHPRLSHP